MIDYRQLVTLTLTETGLLYYGWVDFRMMLAPEMRGLGDGFLFSSSCRVRSSLL